MQSNTLINPVSRKVLWTSYVFSFLPALFLIVDGAAKLFKPAPVIEATLKLGYPERTIVGTGIVLLLSTILYLIPRTSVLGAILLTGYLGGASAAHIRVEDSIFTIVFPVIFGIFLWGGLYLRDVHLRNLIPIRTNING